MRQLVLVLSLFSLALQIGCGAFDGYGRASSDGNTRVTVFGSPGSELELATLTSLAASTPILSAGVLVYFKGINGTNYEGIFYIPNELTSTIFVIPNGNYSVMSFGYTAPSLDPSLTAMKCGYSAEPQVALTGI